MKVGMIDVDGHNFPNLAQMKISAWHKSKGDVVEKYEPLVGGHYDRVYMSKVFTFTPDYEYPINADEIIKGGTGYGSSKNLLYPIEHIYPDYSLYGIEDTAYGYITRGCPRGCDFCIVQAKEGKGETVAPLEEFWKGQKNIKLLDPNIIAVKGWKDNLQQLIDSKAWVDFTQGVDLRLMTEEKAEMLKKIKMKYIHFAWDRWEDREDIIEKLQMFKEITGWEHYKIVVYVLTNYDTTFDIDLARVNILRIFGAQPYVMIYDKQNLPKGHELRRLQRWCNSKQIFQTVERFEDYKG